MTNPAGLVRSRVQAVDDRWRVVPIRTRLTAAAALASTIIIVAVVAVAYVVVHHELLANIDGQLRNQANSNLTNQNSSLKVTNADPADNSANFQVVFANGAVVPGTVALPVTAADRYIAAHGGTSLKTVTFKGTTFRIYTARRTVDVSRGGAAPAVSTPVAVAVQVALPLTAADSELDKLALAFAIITILGVGLITAGSWMVVRRTMRPVETLTSAVEQIAVTRDLTTRIDSYGADELSRLATSFNAMLDALERSLGQQRQLILDSSHELRTPLASMRTNVEVLNDIDRLTVTQREAVLAGIVTQLDELTGLVADVVELARGEGPPTAQEDISYDDLVHHCVDTARRHWRSIVFMVETEPVRVRGIPSRLARAVTNLLDNAGKFSPEGSVVDVSLDPAGVLTVVDRGPGVPEDSIGKVFDRFFRSDEARALPGSGLGLAIVKQIVDNHGGSIDISNRPYGGVVATLVLPVIPPAEPESAADQDVAGTDQPETVAVP